MGTMGLVAKGAISEGEVVCGTQFFGAVLGVVKKQGSTMREPNQRSLGPLSSPQRLTKEATSWAKKEWPAAI